MKPPKKNDFYVFSLWLCLLLLYCLPISADTKKIFEVANEYYKAGDYAKALALYDSILQSGINNSEIHYNIGNCYYKTQQIGKSILHYEKALLLAPHDEDILYNLKLANSKTTDRILSIPELKIFSWWKQLVKSFNSEQWGWTAIGFAWLALIFISIFLFTRYKTSGLIPAILFTVLSIAALFVRQQVLRWETNPNTAILLATSAYVKSAPDPNSTDLFVVHEGLKLQVQDRVGKWCKVRLSDGKVGWLEEAMLGFI
jgi:tetratricopeptide (TPR) repeat protein